MGTTLAALQSGSSAVRMVAVIEGCEYVLAEDTTGVAAAYASTSYDSGGVSVLGGLFVELRNSQSIDPYKPFTQGGSCRLRVLDVSGTGADTFGILVNKRTAGAETTLKNTCDRNDTTITVYSTTGFDNAGTIYIGTEAIKYTGKTGTTFTGCTRGLYSPLGCAASGSGGIRFGGHHRVGQDPEQVLMTPVVSAQPRVWLGRRVSVFLHTITSSTTINSRADAQLVYAGRIVEIDDDPNTFHTVLTLEHIASEFSDGVIGKNMFGATIPEGITLVTGRTFVFGTVKNGVGIFANDLVVVASGASGTNQIDAGRYSLSMLCEKLSAWLAGELFNSRIYGYYSWASPVTSSDGARTKCFWHVDHASSVACSWGLTLPAEIAAFLGLTDHDPDSRGASAILSASGHTNTDNQFQGTHAPFQTLIFKPSAPGRLSQEFAEEVTYDVENIRGTFIDQQSLLPGSIKDGTTSDDDWGVFLLDDKVLMVGSYDDATGQFTKCWLAPFQLTSDNSTEAVTYIGRRVDEPQEGDVTIRQVLVLEETLGNIINMMVYSTGTSGYNHSTYDTLDYGIGLGLQGEVLGTEWERSIANLPSAGMPLTIVIDEPVKFSELLSGDLQVRRSFVRWRNEHFEFAQWRTPQTSLATHTLTDANKAAPSGHEENHRTPTRESSHWQKPIVKFDYCRDFAVGRNGDYLKSLQLEDHTAVDDGGGKAKPYTIELRNTFGDAANTGPAIKSLISQYLETMPIFSRSLKFISRSIDQRYYEGFGVGDAVLITDEFARDPATGVRGVSVRVGFVVKHGYDPGGPSWSKGQDARPMAGEVEVCFLDLQRGAIYAPCAQVDDTQANSGYNAGTFALTCYANKHSESSESADAANFDAGDKIVIVEMDPDDPASPTYWERTISTVVGNVITPTAALALPAWDSAKKYRIIFDKYSVVQASQRTSVFQADEADELVEDTLAAYHFSATEETLDFTANTGSEKAEYVADICFGDGRGWDVGHDQSQIVTLNQYIDRKSAHQSPWLHNGSVTSLIGQGNDVWKVLQMGLMFFGTEHLPSNITRMLTVQPWWRSSDGGPAWLRATISRTIPQCPPSISEGAASGGDYGDPRYTGEHSMSTEWSTSSTTWQTGAAATLSLGVKDLHWGFVWVVIEGAGSAQCRGLAKCLEGVRTVA